jgi:hypothetical protein
MSDRGRREKQLLDIGRFSSLEDAMSHVDDAGKCYREVAIDVIGSGAPITVLSLFFMSALTRSQGLHDAIAREIRHTNPHAVFPLMRAYSETSMMILYVKDHPGYVNAIMDRPKGSAGPRRKSQQAIVSYALSRFKGMKDVYGELTEFGHFGSLAMWQSITPNDEDDPKRISWTSYPRWRDERTALIACAQALEMSEATEHLLREFARKLLPRADGHPNQSVP